jgi:hypothetical protein
MRIMRGVRGIVVVVTLGWAGALGSCGGRGMVVRDPARWGGWYQSDTLGGSTRPRVLRLQVHFDSTADVSVEFVGAGTTHHPGYWTPRGDELTMQPTRGDGTPNELPFRWRFEKGRLIPLAWDRNIYGGTGVTLTKLVPPAQPADSTAGARR